MRKLGLLLAVGLLCLSLAACGQSGESSSGDTADQAEQSQLPEMNETEEVQDEAPDAAEPTEPEPDSQAPLYEDNFSVDTEAVTAFAQKIQSVTVEQDLEGLADLIAYPVYVGFPEGGESVTSKEEFVALGAERIFTQELLQEIQDADLESLSPSMAGFSLSASGKPNIVFGVAEGTLAVLAINY